MSLRTAVCRLAKLRCRLSRRCLLIDATTGFGQFDHHKPSTFIDHEAPSPSDVSASTSTTDDTIVSSTEQATIVAALEKQIATMKSLYRQRRADDIFQLMTAKWSPTVDSLVCYQLAMDLLFENGNHNEVAEVWRKFRFDSQAVSKVPYPRLMTILLAASCYKSNSTDSYKELLSLVEAMSASKVKIPARTLAFAAATAINQNDLDKALEVLELAKTELDQPNTVVQSLKVIVLSKLRRFDEAMGAINALLAIDQPAQSWSRGCVADGALDDFCTALKANSEFKLLSSFRFVQKAITASGRRVNKSIEQLLFVPIAVDHSAEDSGLLRQSSSDDDSLQLRSDKEETELSVEDAKVAAYKTALQKRIVKRILEHGPLQVENYRR
uniref:Uncharacterized protein n=1 Tax=Plectus sambesii TaxID=2011161 RepID=A0A914XDU0_9BILA